MGGKIAVLIAGYENELDKCFFDYKELGQIFINKLLDNEWKLDDSLNLDDKNKLNEFFQKNYDSFKNFGGDMETLLFSSKIAHSKRIFGKKPTLRKKMTLSDIKLGFDL